MIIAQALVYRDFITVVILLKKMKLKNTTNRKTLNNIIPDNWIYVQDHSVRLARIQIFNNWSPYMVEDPNNVWMGLEYFCNAGDEFWSQSDSEISDFAVSELERLGFIHRKNLIDSTVIRMPYTYPVYSGSYSQFHEIISFTDNFENLFLIGRNGMHRYNNQDHSMLTARAAVDNIVHHRKTKDNIWNINAEKKYHESG